MSPDIANEKYKYSLTEIFIKCKFASSIYLLIIEQGLRNDVGYQDEGLLMCDYI
jgi:hypothetical protein